MEGGTDNKQRQWTIVSRVAAWCYKGMNCENGERETEQKRKKQPVFEVQNLENVSAYPTESVRLEKTSGDCLVQPICLKQGQLEQFTQGLVQLDFEYFQGWRLLG